MGMEMGVIMALITLCILQLDASQHVPKSVLTLKMLNYNGTTPAKKNFTLNKIKATWAEAFELCQKKNMSLAKITSQEDQNIIEGYLMNDPPEISVWTAGVVRGVEGSVMKIRDPLRDRDVVWKIRTSKDSSTQDMSYHNWDVGEPLVGDQPAQHCVALLNINYKWWLAECQSKKPFLCEK